LAGAPQPHAPSHTPCARRHRTQHGRRPGPALVTDRTGPSGVREPSALVASVHAAHRHQRGGLPAAAAHGAGSGIGDTQPGTEPGTIGRNLRLRVGAGFQTGLAALESIKTHNMKGLFVRMSYRPSCDDQMELLTQMHPIQILRQHIDVCIAHAHAFEHGGPLRHLPGDFSDRLPG